MTSPSVSPSMIYVTSRPILPDVVDYYLGLLPGVIPAHARARFFNPVPHDSTLRPLSLKLLERPRLLAQIRDLIPDKNRAHLVPYNTTELERDLAIRLGIPMRPIRIRVVAWAQAASAIQPSRIGPFESPTIG